MYCCSICFGDNHLSFEAIPSLSSRRGKCDYCSSENQDLIDPIELREYFELLTNIYVEDSEGAPLIELLKSDWDMFLYPGLGVKQACYLLAAILDDSSIINKTFSPSTANVSDALVRWQVLRGELMHDNRFFPRTEINFDRLERLFGFLLLKDNQIPQEWYRARIQAGSQIFPLGEMGAPPKNLASHGRANPAGIPYLYLASTVLTAVSEIRPHTGEEVSVAKFSVPNNLSIADLRHPRKTVSPFILSDESEILLLRQDIEFLERLGDELTRPIVPRSAAFDYIPSQYLCEMIKRCGYDGLMYRSSVGDGVNMSLFNPEKGVASSVSGLKVSQVTVTL